MPVDKLKEGNPNTPLVMHIILMTYFGFSLGCGDILDFCQKGRDFVFREQ